jgi:hypothetical protein
MNPQTSHDGLAEIFDVDPISNNQITTTNPIHPIVPAENAEAERDFQYVRENLYGLIEKGSDAIDKALEVATESQHPRAFEVAGNLIKNIADLTDKLVTLQKVKHAMDENPEKKVSVNVDKAVFVGSTAELLKNIKSHESTK